MMLEMNKNNEHKFPPTSDERIEVGEFAENIKADNARKMTTVPIMQLPMPKLFLEEKPDPPQEAATPADAASRLGKFGWHEIEGTYIPYLIRHLSDKLVSKRMAEAKLLASLEALFSWDLLSCMRVDLLPATAVEAALLDDINQNHSDGFYGNSTFSKGDPLIVLDDLVEMVAFLRYCCIRFVKESEAPLPKPCGFLQIGLEIVPYILIASSPYLPLFYFDGDMQRLSRRAVKISGWKFAYIKLMCKVQGVRQEFFREQSIDCVELVHLREFFPSADEFQETWPQVNKLDYRAADHVLQPPQRLPEGSQLSAINPPKGISRRNGSKPRPSSKTNARRKSQRGRSVVGRSPSATNVLVQHSNQHVISSNMTPHSFNNIPSIDQTNPHSQSRNVTLNGEFTQNPPSVVRQYNPLNDLSTLDACQMANLAPIETSMAGQCHQCLPSAPLTSPNSLSNHYIPYIAQLCENVPNVPQTAMEVPQMSPQGMSRLALAYPYLPLAINTPENAPRTSKSRENSPCSGMVHPAQKSSQKQTPQARSDNITNSVPLARLTNKRTDLPQACPLYTGNFTSELIPEQLIFVSDSALAKAVYSSCHKTNKASASVEHVAEVIFNKQVELVLMALLNLGVKVHKPTSKQLKWMKHKGLGAEFGMVSMKDLRKHLTRLQTILKM